MSYLVSRYGQQYGPYSLADLRRYLAEGSILNSDYAWTHGMRNWVTVEALLNAEAGASDSALVATSSPKTPAGVFEVYVKGRPAIGLSGMPAAVGAPLTESTPRPVGNAVTWPFHQEKWFKSVWIPLLAGLCATLLLLLLPILLILWWLVPILAVGLSFGIGWTIDAVKWRGRQESRLLPESKDMGRMFKDSFVLAANVICFAIPLGIFALLVAFNKEYTMNQQFEWIVDWIKWGCTYMRHLISGTAYEHFATICGRYEEFIRRAGLRDLLLHLLAPAYIVLAIPMFAVGAIRFALTESFGSFFHIFGNVGLLFQHFGGFLKFLFLSFVLNIALGVLSLVFSETFIVPVVLVASSFWITAYLAGNLAGKIWKSSAKIRAVGDSVPALVRTA
jgi:uncharacterized protein DUF4339/uncharacterized protein DUF4013